MNFFQRLFARPKEPVAAAEPATAAETPDSATDPSKVAYPGLRVGHLSDIGQNPDRERNEDSLYAFSSTLFSDGTVEPFGLFIVADGMGGHERGEIASDLATRTVADRILREIYLPFLNQDSQSASNRSLNEILMGALEDANSEVHKQAPEGGTTLTAAVILGNNAYVAHVGDSRAYVYHQGQLKQITQDHSYVARLVELGQATAEEALTHRYRNVLYRALGQAGTLEVETKLQPLPAGSQLLLCSDGLWNMIADDKIASVVANAPSPQEACQQLIDLANSNGGEDNISAIIVRIGDPV